MHPARYIDRCGLFGKGEIIKVEATLMMISSQRSR
jgi:hypothetical protein